MTTAIADNELRVARDGLLTRAAELRDRLVRVRRDLRRELAPLPKDDSDAAIVIENDEVLQAIENSALGELRRIDQALERIHAGTFGRCENCGARINAERLRSVPHATRCIKCEPG